MSSRQRQRLLQARQGGGDLVLLGGLPRPPLSSDDESECEPSPPSSCSPSVELLRHGGEEGRGSGGFSALLMSESDGDDEGDGEEEEETDSEGGEVPGRVEPANGSAPCSGPPHTERGGAEEGKSGGSDEDHEFLDNIIAENRTSAGQLLGVAGESHSPATQNSLLCCSSYHLNVMNELNRQFGLRSEERGALGNGRRRRRNQTKSSFGGSNAIPLQKLRKLTLGPPIDDWPSRPPSFVGGGIGMVSCPSPPHHQETNGIMQGRWFKFRYSDAYLQLEQRFLAVQAAHDPDLLSSFVSQSPYHTQALFQLAMVYAHIGQMDKAGEMLRLVLFVFEMAYGDGFSPLSGDCRLDFKQGPNGLFMGALFRHMQFCGMRGAYRTALEVGRLLLSLDPQTDAMGTLLFIDSLALRAGEPAFVVEMMQSNLVIGPKNPHESLDERDTIQSLPGFCYSYALALLSLGDRSEALVAMQQALRKFPGALQILLEKVGIADPARAARPPRIWSSILSHKYFLEGNARILESRLLKHLVQAYCIRAQTLWGSDPALDLLYDGAGLLLRGSPEQDLSSISEVSPVLQKYSAIPLSDLEDNFPRLPIAEVLDPRQRIRFAGGLGPADIAAMRVANQAGAVRALNGHGGPPPQGNLDLSLPLMELFWRSALPWNSI